MFGSKIKKQIEKIEQQKKIYRCLLSRSQYRKELEDDLWERAGELASQFDLSSGDSSQTLQKQNQKGLALAFQTIRQDSKQSLDVSFIKDVHAQTMSFVSPTQGGLFRRGHARWINSTMIVANWVKIPYLMDNLMTGINQGRVPAFYWEERPNAQFQRLSHNPVIQAIEANYNTIAIHPFSDGNKRTARLISTWILDRYGYIPLCVYDREAYITGIEDYYSTRHPGVWYMTMCDQMRKSYENAIDEATRAEICRVHMGNCCHRMLRAKALQKLM